MHVREIQQKAQAALYPAHFRLAEIFTQISAFKKMQFPACSLKWYTANVFL